MSQCELITCLTSNPNKWNILSCWVDREEMKLFALTMGLVAECCYWEGVKSGRYLECKPDHYMKGACESGSRNDCNIDNGIIGGSSFGIKCCPTTKDLDFAERDECQWFGGASGDNVSCPNGTAAFGRCSTSARSGSGGDCNNLSHQVQCCQSVTTINELTCGWIYARCQFFELLLIFKTFQLWSEERMSNWACHCRLLWRQQQKWLQKQYICRHPMLLTINVSIQLKKVTTDILAFLWLTVVDWNGIKIHDLII